MPLHFGFVAEWVEYDNEAKALDLEFQANMRAPTSAESASTDTGLDQADFCLRS